ncbi:hypothetical protein K492DRAFT_123830 [Lichtheimia hyalospora FSU 10163]|nr:hypothetical protein K492DRAFT_123830 [Lichtheimia hyalospora FSU 10163]
MTTPTPVYHHSQHRPLSDSEQEEDENDEDEDDWADPVALVPRSTTTNAHAAHDDYENLYRLQGIYGLHDTHSRLDNLIHALKQQTGDSDGSHLAALQELAEILSVSNEETLAGALHCKDLVVTLLDILKGAPSTLNPVMDEEMMLAMLAEDPMMNLSASQGGQTTEKMILACQCLSNLLDAFPPAASIVVVNNGIPVLCDKLEPSDYIDLQEQALYALEKVSIQFPRDVVRGGGLNVAVKHFHFFTIHFQRSALQTASNCMRGIEINDEDIFSGIQQVIDILKETLSYPDQTVVDLTCLCWARLIDSCGANKMRIEQLITPHLLEKFIQLIPVNGSNNNTVRPSAFNHLLRIFRAISRHSPHLTCQLLDLDLTSKFYQIITGASSMPDDMTDQIVNVTVDTKWRDTVSTILKIIVDLLPPLPKGKRLIGISFYCKMLILVPLELWSADRLLNTEPIASRTRSSYPSTTSMTPPLVLGRFANYDNNENMDVHIRLLKAKPELLERMGRILLPLLIEVYTSMVNVALREQITHALLKIIYYCDKDTLRRIITHAPLSAFLVEILTQKDHTVLVMDALYQAELLVTKMPDVYYSVFEIEGVLHEIDTIAQKSLAAIDIPPQQQSLVSHAPIAAQYQHEERSLFKLFRKHANDGLGDPLVQRYITMLAQNFMCKYHSLSYHVRSKEFGYNDRLRELHSISLQLAENGSAALERFLRIVNGSHIGISSFELSRSGILDALLHYLINDDPSLATRRMVLCNILLQNNDTSQQALCKLIDRLQIALSRSEQFQITTPLEAPNDRFRNPSNMLNKQIRVRLVREGALEQRSYIVQVPVVAKLKTLEEYLVTRVGPLLNTSALSLDNMHNEPYDDDSDADSMCDPDVIESLLDRGQDTDDEDEDDENVPMQIDDQVRDERTHIKQQQSQKKQDGEWKVHFFAHGASVDPETTIYGAIHRSLSNNNNNMGRIGFWTSSFTFTFRLERSTQEQEPKEPEPTITATPASVGNGTTCDKVLQLLAALYQLIERNNSSTFGTPIINVDFVNRKLTAKMQRQLEESLIIASGCLPDWTYWLMQKYSFLFPFETRYQFLQSTAFGYTRLMARWQSLQMRGNNNNNNHDGEGQHHLSLLDSTHEQQQQPLLHQSTRHKVKIPRENMLMSATKILDNFGAMESTLEVQYTGEEGSGLGPTLEFYAAVSKEFSKMTLGMWRHDDVVGEYVSSKNGLFPMPMSPYQKTTSTGKTTLKLFETLGRFIAKAMVDFRIIDMPFSPAFFKILFSESPLVPLELLRDIDPVLCNSLQVLQDFVDEKQAILSDTSMTAVKKASALRTIHSHLNELCLDFTLPGHPEIMLQEHGENMAVTIDNVNDYMDMLLDMLVGSGIREQMAMFRKGFTSIFDLDHLKILAPEELVSLFGNSVEDWSYSTISSAIHADHGYTMESRTVQHLVAILSEMTQQERRDFLQFTTGSPRLPIGGWHAMRPVFTVVRKQCEPPLLPDDYLPSVMTCANYLKLPDYSNKQVMYQRLVKSMCEGKNCFLLS